MDQRIEVLSGAPLVSESFHCRVIPTENPRGSSGGIFGMAIGASIVNHRFLGSAFGLARNDMSVALFGEHFLYLRLSA
jgi:hypothetical protein